MPMGRVKVSGTQQKMTRSMLTSYAMMTSSVTMSSLFHKNVHGQTVCLEGNLKLNYVRRVERNTCIMYVRLNGSINMDWTIKIYANCVFLVQKE
jgi:hypothetical protein